MEMRTWRELIAIEMKKQGETWDDVVKANIDGSFDRGFDAGYGGEEGEPFCLWTKNRVYFPVCYDGLEWCGSAPRNPADGVVLEHQGG